MARRVNLKQKVMQGDQNVDSFTDLATFLAETVTDDLGVVDTIVQVPATSSYTAYTLNLTSSPITTYFYDVDRDTDEGAVIKLNGDSTEFNIWPDFMTDEEITSVQIKNDSSTKRIIRVIQIYLRIVTV